MSVGSHFLPHPSLPRCFGAWYSLVSVRVTNRKKVVMFEEHRLLSSVGGCCSFLRTVDSLFLGTPFLEMSKGLGTNHPSHWLLGLWPRTRQQCNCWIWSVRELSTVHRYQNGCRILESVAMITLDPVPLQFYFYGELFSFTSDFHLVRLCCVFRLSENGWPALSRSGKQRSLWRCVSHTATNLSLSLPSSNSTFSQPLLEKCISDALRIW